MATFDGFIVTPAPDIVESDNNITPEIRARGPWDIPPIPDREADYPVAPDAFINNLLVEQENVQTFQGYVADSSYYRDWYDTIHVLPGRLDVGPLLAVETRELVVWNAYTSIQNLSSIDENDLQGVTITEPPPGPAPTDYAPLEERTYSVDLSLDGPPSIDGNYVFNFPSDAPIVYVTGSRVTVLNFPYENGVVEQQQWLTDIQKAVDGETRIAVRSKPRMSLSCEYRMDRLNNTALQGILFASSNQEFGIPLWSDADHIHGDLIAGATEIFFDPQYLRFEDSGLLMVWQSEGAYEVLGITVVLGDRITLEDPVLNNYYGAYYIAPIRRGKIVGLPALQKRNMGAGINKINFVMTENYLVPSGTYPQYKSTDVLLDRTFLSSAVMDSIHKERLTIDSESGVFETFALRNKTKEYRTQNWQVQQRQAKYELHQFLASRKGAQKAFYYPSWRQDVVVTGSIGASDLVLTHEPNEYKGYGNEGTREGFIRLYDGTIFYRELVFGADNSISLGTSLGQTVAPEEIEFFCFLHLLRLDTDSISIRYSDLNMDVSVKLVTIA